MSFFIAVADILLAYRALSYHSDQRYDLPHYSPVCVPLWFMAPSFLMLIPHSIYSLLPSVLGSSIYPPTIPTPTRSVTLPPLFLTQFSNSALSRQMLSTNNIQIIMCHFYHVLNAYLSYDLNAHRIGVRKRLWR